VARDDFEESPHPSYAVMPCPHLVWRCYRLQQHSSGWCHYGEVHVNAGTDRTDQRMVLLHELAHWSLGMRHGHDETFWLKAWEFYRRYRVPIRHAQVRECSYRKGAERAYRKSRRGMSPKPSPDRHSR